MILKARVMYHSRSGNTKKVAEAISQVIGAAAEAVPPAYPPENLNVLFLGAGAYANKVDKKVEEFIRTLNPKRAQNVALFGTVGSKDAHIQYMKDLLKAQGVNVIDETFVCKGKYFLFFNRKHPNAEELKSAQAFAKAIMDKIAK